MVVSDDFGHRRGEVPGVGEAEPDVLVPFVDEAGEHLFGNGATVGALVVVHDAEHGEHADVVEHAEEERFVAFEVCFGAEFLADNTADHHAAPDLFGDCFFGAAGADGHALHGHGEQERTELAAPEAREREFESTDFVDAAIGGAIDDLEDAGGDGGILLDEFGHAGEVDVFILQHEEGALDDLGEAGELEVGGVEDAAEVVVERAVDGRGGTGHFGGGEYAIAGWLPPGRLDLRLSFGGFRFWVGGGRRCGAGGCGDRFLRVRLRSGRRGLVGRLVSRLEDS